MAAERAANYIALCQEELTQLREDGMGETLICKTIELRMAVAQLKQTIIREVRRVPGSGPLADALDAWWFA